MSPRRRLLEITSNTSKRSREIMQAVFDYYVRKRFVDGGKITDFEDINEKELRIFATKAKCDKESLCLAIRSSLERTKGFTVVGQPLKDEVEVIKAVIKLYAQGLKIPLSNYRRDFGNMTVEINRFKPDLKLQTQELINFTYPAYRQIFEEIFRVNKILFVPLEATEG